MQRLLTFALLGLVLAVSPLALADDWSKTYTITGKPDLRVETSDANLRVDTWDKNTIDVHITSKPLQDRRRRPARHRAPERRRRRDRTALPAP